MVSAFFNRNNLALLPFTAVFLTSFVLPTASNRIVFYVCAPFLLWQIWQHRDDVKLAASTLTFKLFALYLGYFTLTLFWSENASSDGVLKTLRDVASIGIFCTALSLTILRHRMPDYLPLAFAGLCAAYTLGVAVWQYGFDAQGMIYRLQGGGRYENSIHFAFLCCIGILAILACWMTAKRRFTLKTSALLVTIAVVLLAGIALSQTRSAFIALIACLGIVMLSGHARVAIALVVSGVCIVAILFANVQYFEERFAGRLDSYRFEIWKDAADEIAEKPLFGHGILAEPKFYPEAADAKRGWKSPHNVLLGHAYTGGIVGLLLFVALLAQLMRIAFRDYRENMKAPEKRYRPLFAGMIFTFGVCVSLFNFAHYIEGVHIQWLVFWVPFAILLAMDTDRRKAQCSNT